MSELLGADTRRVDIIAGGLRGSCQDIENLRTMAQRAVTEMRNAWGGPDFECISQRWEQESGPRLTDVSSALSTMAAALRTQAQGQRHASGNTEGSNVRVAPGGTRGGLPGGGGGASSWGGDVTLVDERLATKRGVGDGYAYELSAGKVEAEADYSVDVDAHGNVVASAGASAAVYAGYAAGALRRGNDFANGTVGGAAYVGAAVSADASGSIGPDGARGHLGAEAFAGAKAEADLSGTVAGVAASAGAEVSYGIGAHAEVDAELSATNVGISADIGVALGVGTGVAFDVSVDPREVIANIGQVAEGVGGGLTLAGDQVESLLDW